MRSAQLALLQAGNLRSWAIPDGGSRVWLCKMFVLKENVYKSNVCVASMNSCCLNYALVLQMKDNILIRIIGDVMFINIVSTVGSENGLLFSYCNTLFCCDVRTH